VQRRCAAALRWLAAAALVAICGAAAAQTYPVKPIRFILQHAPGGFGDITARLVAQKMSASMGQQVIIDNRPSSGAIIAANMVAKAEPDGYTLLLTGSGTAASASLFKSLPYDVLKDFEQVSTKGIHARSDARADDLGHCQMESGDRTRQNPPAVRAVRI